MRALIIDDEKKARRLLHTILKEYCPQITSITEAEDLMTGVAEIRQVQPDIVFLDIEMPDYLGIEIGGFLEKEEMNFSLVFTTAYSEYAIKAFEVNAVDYLLKPIRPKQIKDVIAKISVQQQHNLLYDQLQELKASIQTNSYKKVGIPVSDGIIFQAVEDIVCIQADGMYSTISTKEQKAITVSKPLKYFCELLEEYGNFYRCHRSALVNLNFVKQYVKKDGYSIVMENGVEVPLARDKKDTFLLLLREN